MELKTLDLLLSNIGNLPSKPNKVNSNTTTGFDKILDEINTKFTNIENNINNLDGKNLPGPLKEELLRLLNQIEVALHNLMSNEEKFSLDKSSENPKDLYSLNKQEALTKETGPVNISDLFKDVNSEHNSESNDRINIFTSVKNSLGNLKSELNKLSEQFINNRQNNILQNLYEKLGAIKDNIGNGLTMPIENDLKSLFEKGNIKSDVDRFSSNVKAIIDNSIDKLVTIMGHLNDTEEINSSVTSHFKNSNILPLLEQFNKQSRQDLLSMKNRLSNTLSDKGVLDEKSVLIDKLFNGDIKKILFNALRNENAVNNYSKSMTNGSDLNFINPTKVDIAFKETFLENKKDKNKIPNVENKTGNIKNNSNDKTSDYRVIKEVNSQNKEQQIKNDLNGTDKHLSGDGANKDPKTLNIRVDYMTIDTAKDNKGVLENIDESLQKNQITKEITNKLNDYIKFIKQENISKAELKLNLEDLGKLKILFTDAGDKIHAKIYTDNDNIKHIVAQAFDNIKESLVQKGINLSQYDFYHLNKDNQDQQRDQDSQKKNSNSYVNKNIKNVEKKSTNINALYA